MLMPRRLFMPTSLFRHRPHTRRALARSLAARLLSKVRLKPGLPNGSLDGRTLDSGRFDLRALMVTLAIVVELCKLLKTELVQRTTATRELMVQVVYLSLLPPFADPLILGLRKVTVSVA